MTDPTNTASTPPVAPKTRLHPALRITGWVVVGLILLKLVLLATLLLFLHSANGGRTVAKLTSTLLNALDTGMQFEVSSIEMDWPLTLRVHNIRLSDTQGPWLELATANITLVPSSLVPSPSLHWHLQASSALLQQGKWSRLPVLPPSPPESKAVRHSPDPLHLMPAWLSVSADNLLLENFHIGAPALALPTDEKYIAPWYTVRLKAQTSLSAAQSTLTANAEIHPIKDMAGEIVDKNVDEPKKTEITATTPALTRLSLNATWADATLRLHTRVDDAALVWPHLHAALPMSSATPNTAGETTPELPKLLLQGDITLRLPSLTLTPDFPLHILWQWRLTMPTLAPVDFSGTLALNGEEIAWNTVHVLYPADISTVQSSTPHALGLKLSTAGTFHFTSGPAGQLDVDIADVALLRQFGLPGPLASGPLQASVRVDAAALRDNPQAQKPYMQGEIHSPALRLPQGLLQNVRLKMLAHVPAPPTLPPTRNGAAPAAWTRPTTVTGSVGAMVQSCMGLGPAKVSTTWAVDDIFQTMGMHLTDIQATVEGLKLTGKFHSSGKRINDAALDLTMTNSTAMARLANIPLKGGCPATLQIRFTPPTPTKEYSLHGQLKVGAGSYDAVQWLSGEGQIRVDPTLASLNFTLKGKLSARLRCSYNFRNRLLHIDSMEIGESSKKIGVQLEHPTEVHFATGIRMAETALSIRPAGNLHVQGQLLPEKLALNAAVQGIPLSIVKAFTTAPIPHGTLSARAELHGNPASPTGTLTLRVDDIPLSTKVGSPKASLQIDGILARAEPRKGSTAHSLQLKARWEGLESLKDFDATAHIPLRFTPTPTLAMDAPLSAHVFWRGEISPLWRLVPLPGRTLSGTGELQVRVAGNMRAPTLAGHVFVARGKFVDSIDGILLDAINLEARYTPQGPALVRLHATDGRGGTLALDGTLSGPSAHKQLAMRGIINKLRPLRRDDVAVQLSGTLDISGPVLAPRIAGALCVDQGLIQLLNGFGSATTKNLTIEDRHPQPQAASVTAEDEAEARAPHCALSINAPGRLYIRGKGLESEWKAALTVNGRLDTPHIGGTVTPIRGQLELLGHQFTMNSGNITFTGVYPPNPALDVTLGYKSADITALIVFTGSAKQPKMRLSSQPALPQDEIIAQILFGKSMHSLSRFQALQAANTARQLVDVGPSALDIMSSTRDLLGLEVLRIGSAEATRQTHAPRDASLRGTSTTATEELGPTIEAGKYILDNVYVGLDQGTDATTGTTARVEIELTPSLSVEGRSSSHSTGMGLNWKHDY
ncbi:MAG: translocation/assembly module TamB domain-containing protein [Desulfovibrionaceae bacterium]